MVLFGECWLGLTLVQVKLAVPYAVRGQAISLLLGIATFVGNSGPAAVGFLDPGSAAIGRIILWHIAAFNVLAVLLFVVAAWQLRELGSGAPTEQTPIFDDTPAPVMRRRSLQHLRSSMSSLCIADIPMHADTLGKFTNEPLEMDRPRISTV